MARSARRMLIVRPALCAAVLASLTTTVACTSTHGPSGGTTHSGANVSTATPGGTASGTVATTPTSAVPVPPPTKGDIHQTVPARKVVTRRAVSLDATAHFTSAIAARLTRVEPISAKGNGPGEISGPALELTIKITNDGKSSIDLGNAVVNLADSRKQPGLPIAGAPAKPFSGTLSGGRSAVGIYVFTVPVGHRAPVSVTVSYTAAAPVVLFVGNAA